MGLKLQNKKYTQQELQDLVEQEVNERLANVRRGRKGEFDVSGVNIGADDPFARMPEELQIKSDHLYILGKILNCDPRRTKLWTPFENLCRKAMDTATSNEGAEWVPTMMSSELIRSVRLALRVAALFRWIDMPSNPYKLPIEGGDAIVTMHAEQTSDTGTKITASTPGTKDITFDAVKFAARVLASVELEEDSAVPILPMLRDKLITALAEAIEDAAINADTTTPHQDSDVTAADDYRKGWKGFRKFALSLGTATVNLSTFNIANLRAIRTAMGKYGVDPTKLAWIPGVAAYNKMLGLDEVLTVDKLGPQATILTGQLASCDGIPVVQSAKIRETLNASGVYDGITTTKTVLPLVHTGAFLFGNRRQVTVKVLRELYAETDQIAIIATQRLDMQPCYDMTTEPVVGLGYNF